MEGETLAIHNIYDCDKQEKGVAEYLEEVVDIIPGKQYTLTYEATTCPESDDRLYAHSAVWIDVNQTGVFNTSSFMVTSGYNILEVVAHVKLPKSVKIGPTRMRIMVAVFPNTNDTFDPCMNYTYGGVKDFTVNIKNHSSPTPSPTMPPTPKPTSPPSAGMGPGTVALIAIICLVIGCGVGIGVYRYRKAEDNFQYGIQDDYGGDGGHGDKDQPPYQTDLQTDL